MEKKTLQRKEVPEGGKEKKPADGPGSKERRGS